MTTNQKLEFSREVRQWMGLTFSVASVAAIAVMSMFPDKTEKVIEKIRKKVDK